MEQNKCFQAMNRLVSQIQRLESSAFLAVFQENLDLKQFKISQITPDNASSLHHEISIKFMKNYSPKTELNWGENQLRLFMWILVCYLQLRQVTLQQLGQADWEYFCQIFPNKQPILFEYQAKSLISDPSPTKKWTTEEDELFTMLVKNKEGKYKWSQLAKELYINSRRQYYRTPKQCRERWLNHLDPSKSKDQWELRQDYILISHVHTKGKKWAQISKILKLRRNEHSIKNRFKSLITKENKLHSEHKQEQELIEIIFKKYDKHISKMKLLNTINNMGSSPQQDKNNEVYGTNSSINPNQIFFVSKSSPQTVKTQVKPTEVQQSEGQLPIVTSSMDLAMKEERQKYIRADMFLSNDPFDLLKRFFKSRDSYMHY